MACVNSHGTRICIKFALFVSINFQNITQLPSPSPKRQNGVSLSKKSLEMPLTATKAWRFNKCCTCSSRIKTSPFKKLYDTSPTFLLSPHHLDLIASKHNNQVYMHIVLISIQAGVVKVIYYEVSRHLLPSLHLHFKLCLYCGSIVSR